MPELPEVETICRGLTPQLVGKTVVDVIIRKNQLRYPVPENLADTLSSAPIEKISRRGKYLLVHFDHGSLIIHLGMSGSLQIFPQTTPYKKHDHVDLLFKDGMSLRFNDARRFGSVLWSTAPLEHKLLKNLGPEPLTKDFSAKYIYDYSRNRKRAIKLMLMDSHVVVGVGNIYANEALFAANIHPATQAGTVTLEQYETLVNHTKTILKNAIAQGGTTFKDFINSEGKPGYFKQELKVYGRGGQPCTSCNTTLSETRLGQRTTVFCPECQG